MPYIGPRRHFMNEIVDGKLFVFSRAWTVLIEPDSVSQQIEAFLVFIEFGKPCFGKGATRGWIARWIPYAPIKQCEQKTQGGHAVHGIGGGNLADAVCFSEHLNEVDASELSSLP